MDCKRCFTTSGIDQAFVEERVREVVEKLDHTEDISVTVVAVADADECGAVLDEIDVADEEAFLRNCEDADTSISYRAADEEFVLIKADKPFVQENASALRGLLAHEMMHTVQRRQGIEQDIETVARSHEEEAITRLRDLGMDDQEIGGFIRTVFQTAIFALKDLYANTELIQQSFVADLEEYYHHMLGIDEFCPAPDFYGEEAELYEVQEAIAFELGLLPAWLPFEALSRPEADRLRHRIQDCYEQDLPQVSYHIHDIRDLYHDQYNQRDEFKNRFFQEIFTSASDVIEKKIARVGDNLSDG